MYTCIDKWFDTCNSRTVHNVKPHRCGMGLHEAEQIQALMRMKSLMETMRYSDNEERKSKKPFQKGIIISIESILSLYEEMKTEGYSYLLTSRLNQDCLENLFSRIRGMGSNNSHPTPVEAMNRVRLLTIGKDPQHIVNNPAVEMSGISEPFLTSEITAEIIDHQPVEMKYSIFNGDQ